MQIRLFEDSNEIQLRFKGTDQPDAVISQSGKNCITLLTHVKFILAVPWSISKIFVPTESENIIVRHPWFSNLHKVPSVTV